MNHKTPPECAAAQRDIEEAKRPVESTEESQLRFGRKMLNNHLWPRHGVASRAQSFNEAKVLKRKVAEEVEAMRGDVSAAEAALTESEAIRVTNVNEKLSATITFAVPAGHRAQRA